MPEPDRRFLEFGTKVACTYGRAWHGFELHGLHHLPGRGPALLVCYHAFMPLDLWLFGAEVYRRTGRDIRGLGDHFLFKVPGLAALCRRSGVVPGTRENATRLLAEGNLVGVAPGGVREALARREDHYKVLWGDRLGFAIIALEAGVPILPVFVENSEETFRSPGAQHPLLAAFYEETRVPIVPVVGLGALALPVKLVAHIGAPLEPQPGESPEALRDRARAALQGLVDAHQDRARPRLLRALAARFSPPRPD